MHSKWEAEPDTVRVYVGKAAAAAKKLARPGWHDLPVQRHYAPDAQE